MAERSWTKPQQDAIEARGGSVLVSAAAGSGKTAVLVERAVRLLCDRENPVSADRLLVVTFSNAAAAEMKARLNIRLSAMIAKDPANVHLQRQQALLQGAQISTVHSFCLELIRSNFQYLEISPDFVLSDENEMRMLEEECVRDCIGDFYEQEDSGAFYSLVELLSSARDDAALVDTVLRVYHFSRSHPFYEAWLEQVREMYDTALPPAETVWGRSVLQHVRETLRYCREVMGEALALTQEDAGLEKAYQPAFQSDLVQIETSLEAAEAGDWDRLVRLLAGFQFQTLGRASGGGSAKAQAKAIRDRCKKTIQELADKHINATEEDFRRDMADLRPKVEVLIDLVLAFGRQLWQRKGERRRLDFSDLEHLALTLLVEREGEAYLRTAKALEIASRFDMVMVDEYQDTNEVQDLIFTSVSDMQRNLFMVGDVKQSIYSFRQAMPEIFLKKKEVFFPYDSGQFPAKIILDTNFRSRREVTDGINHLFSLLMSRRVGDMEYTEEESLKCGATYPDVAGMRPEFLLVGPGEGENLSAEPEADAVAGRIRQLLEERHPIAEEGALRPVRPGDICILLRSHRNRADAYVQALDRLGIPGWAETAGGYLQAREVSAVISLLRVLDNPLLDVELVAVLLSPLFHFTDDDIARIRLTRRGVPFYNALVQAAETDSKSMRFLEVFRHLRVLAAILPADRLLLAIYDATNAFAVMRSLPMGEARVSNLQLLVEYAAAYHNLGYKKLGGFVGFLNRLEERGGDLAPAGSAGPDLGAGAVRIMSVHKSKGLEFPVVILADTFRRFNKADLRSATLLHSAYGFACVRRDERTMRQFPTVPMQSIRLESGRTQLSEELRILYVALTRAREKLIVSGYYRYKLEKHLADLYAGLQKNRLPPYLVGEAACYGDWILMALLHHKSCASLRELAGVTEGYWRDDENPWEIRIVQARAVVEAQERKKELVHKALPDPEILKRLKEQAEFVYPYQNHIQIPAKLAVSAVAKGQSTSDYRFRARPKFLERQGLTPAERGNAMHKFMQFADYQQAKTDLDGEILRMGEQAFLSEAEVTSLSKQKLRKFFNSQLAGRIFASEKVLRELKFTVECGKDILGDAVSGMDDEALVVLQGVADCVFLEEDGAVIVDYKTDFVTEEQELVERYRKQLELYRILLQPSLAKPVKECLLYSFHLGRQIAV